LANGLHAATVQILREVLEEILPSPFTLQRQWMAVKIAKRILKAGLSGGVAS